MGFSAESWFVVGNVFFVRRESFLAAAKTDRKTRGGDDREQRE